MQSVSEFKDLHSLYTNVFDDNHPHDHPPVYHAIHSLHDSLIKY